VPVHGPGLRSAGGPGVTGVTGVTTVVTASHGGTMHWQVQAPLVFTGTVACRRQSGFTLPVPLRWRPAGCRRHWHARDKVTGMQVLYPEVQVRKIISTLILRLLFDFKRLLLPLLRGEAGLT